MKSSRGTAALYDSIGHGYAKRRRPDPRIEAKILEALGDAQSVVNVGAGAGSYEPRDRRVIAVEPSQVMIRQRSANAAPVFRASATDLPFRDQSFDVSMAILTIHHWPNYARGLAEMRRVAQRTVLLTFDTSVGGFWLTDYFPEIIEIDRDSMPAIADVERHLDNATVTAVPIPHDCTDGFLGAHWRRPEAYLDPRVRSATSVFAKMKKTPEGLSRLEADLRSGEWRRRYGHFLSRVELDLGYRLIVS